MSTLEIAGRIKDLEIVYKSIQKLTNRASEFDGGSFLILVVGPVKSGKSTLVNLIAHAHVSPTHFLECTVRPSIISKGQEESITSIFSTADKVKKVEQFDSVIDSLRGFEKLENIPEIGIEKKELNDINLDACVSLALEESVINADHTLVTSITTSGGELLKDNIFLVDMPGLDGGYANLDNPIYETNVFEAAYWHSEEEKQAVIKAQVEFAENEMGRRNFQLKGSIYSLNLGKVADAASYEGVENLQEEAAKFQEFEKDLYGKVISNSTDIRLRSVIGRTLNQLEKLDNSVSDLIDKQEAIDEEYRAAAASFDELLHQANELGYDGGDFRKMVQVYMDDDLKEFVEIVKEYYDSACNSAYAGGAKGKEATRALVTKFMTDSSAAIKSKFLDSHEHSLVRQYLRKLSNLKDDVSFIEKMNAFLKQKGCMTFDSVSQVADFPMVDFDLQGAFDVKNINHPTVPHIGIPNPFGTYSIAEIQHFLKKAMECITGIDHTHTGRTIKGYLQLTVGKSICKAANDLYDQYVPVRKQRIIDFLERQKEAYLGELVPDKEEFDRKDALLRSINTQVQSFKDSIR